MLGITLFQLCDLAIAECRQQLRVVVDSDADQVERLATLPRGTQVRSGLSAGEGTGFEPSVPRGEGPDAFVCRFSFGPAFRLAGNQLQGGVARTSIKIFPNGSRFAVEPGGTTQVESHSSMMQGPALGSRRSERFMIAVSHQPWVGPK